MARMRRVWLVVGLFSGGCGPGKPPADSGGSNEEGGGSAEDGSTDETVDTSDRDGDGHDALDAGGDDCDDGDASVHPKPHEDARDLVDDDCDGLVDEDWVATGDVLITELMVDPDAAAEQHGEWLELRNTSAEAVDLLGWSIVRDGGTSTWTLDRSLVLGAGDRVVLGPDVDPRTNGGVPVDLDYPHDQLLLPNAGASLAVVMGTLSITAVAWDEDAGNVVRGAALQVDRRFEDAASQAVAERWCAATEVYGDGDRGTPGAENSPCDELEAGGGR